VCGIVSFITAVVCAAADESGPEAAAAAVAGAASVARARHASRAARSLLYSRTRTRWCGGRPRKQDGGAEKTRCRSRASEYETRARPTPIRCYNGVTLYIVIILWHKNIM